MNAELLIMGAALFLGVLYILFSATMKKHSRPVSKAKTSAAGQDEFALYRKLTATDPENAENWLKWGNALSLSAPSCKNQDLSIHRYNEACSCFQRAVELAPSSSQAWKNWGQTQFELYRFQGCEDPDTLEQANQKYHNATSLSPDNSLLWQQWGEELHQSAYIASGELRNSLMKESAEKIARGTELNMGFTVPSVSDAGPATQGG